MAINHLKRVLILFLAAGSSVLAAGPNSNPAKVCPTPRQLTWQKREVTALIHFGPNTFTAREWGSGTESPAVFNPSSLDCAQWVEAAQAFGAKSITMTCKHHDGFCLWPSEYTQHSVKNSPWKNGQGDVIRELSEACRKAGLGFGIYLSPADLNHPDYGFHSARYNGEVDITKGQRVESFELTVTPEGGDPRLIKGGTIGYIRIIRLGDAPIREMLLRIKQTRAEPFLTAAVY